MVEHGTPAIVSIATIPSRIAYIKPTLESLLEGERAADLIIVNTPRYCELEKSEYVIPDFLSDPAIFGGKVRHEWSDKDWGPGTKILGAVRHLPDRDAVLIIADDDVIYDHHFVSRLYDAQVAEKKSSFSFYTYRTHGIAVGQGCDGLSIWTPNLFGIEEFALRHVSGTTVMYHDDVWIACYLVLSGITVKRLTAATEKGLIYQQTLPNNVLADQSGELKREKIAATHIPRLLREIGLSPVARLGIWLRHSVDSMASVGLRAAGKAKRMFATP